jgi:nucleoside-diphosphate-sugar epimerase
MAVCLITGASGFLGQHLGRLLLQSDETAPPIAIGRSCPEAFRLDQFRPVDLEDRGTLISVVAETNPSLVFHVAGKTPPADSEAFYRQNVLATLHLLDAVRELGRACRVVLVGSAAELGPVPVEVLPVGEAYPCHPIGPYGLSKWLATCAGLASRPPVEVIVARVFNPIGPGLAVSQALGRFASELATGSGPMVLTVRDLESRRDFIDVRDVAKALVRLGEAGTPGRIYHVGTGRSRRVGDGLERLIKLSGRQVTMEVAPTLVGSTGPLDSRADIRRIQDDTAWSPEVPWDVSIRDLWEEARDRARRD